MRYNYIFLTSWEQAKHGGFSCKTFSTHDNVLLKISRKLDELW